MLGLSVIALALSPWLQDAARDPETVLQAIRAAGNDAPAKLFEELGKQKSADALDALIEGLGSISKVDKQCKGFESFLHFAGVEEVQEDAVEYLADRATSSQEKIALHATLRLGELWPASKDVLAELALEHAAADGRSIAIMWLVEKDMPLTAKQISKLARSKDAGVRYEGLLAQTARLENKGKRFKSILKLARDRDAIARLAAVELLREEEPPQRFALLFAALGDADPRVNRKALDCLETIRLPQSLETMILRLPDADVGETVRIANALRRLTGLSLGTNPKAWQKWWEQEGATFKIPVDNSSDARDPGTSEGAKDEHQSTASFYGLPIFAQHLVFAVDSSDSMKQPAGSDRYSTRMDIAKGELRKAIEGFPKSSTFDIVNFGKSAWSWQEELVSATSKTKKQALAHIDDLPLSWGTEVYVALREAFRDPRADTILLMTDGDPQLSLLQDRDAMRRIVVQWNRTRHTTIDCITIGTNRAWLRKIAEATGGRYQRIE
ncbi:MAG: VWA domain-containing protein [Planctomycetes bacterium]|nr:VWA domain-containing protein [Planctomycetota bacterium]